MSFLDDIVSGIGGVVSSVGNVVGGLFGSGGGLGGNILKTIMTGFALNQVTKSINKSNPSSSSGGSASTAAPPDTGVKLQIAPAGENRIPVIYGTAHIGGIITDVKMSNDNQTMWFVVTICEVTGGLLSSGDPSQFRFNYIYWNSNRIIFKNDGITADYTVDPSGNIDRSISGLVEVYCFNNGSGSPTIPYHYTAGTLSSAYNIMPDWTANHLMDGLVFAIVKVTYNKEKNITGLANMNFEIRNTMTMPGDCLFDYMTSTRYGAGIDPAEIKSE